MDTIKAHFGHDGLSAIDARDLSRWVNCFAPCTAAAVSAGGIGTVEVSYAVAMLRAGLACPHAREDWADMRAMLARLQAPAVAKSEPIAARMAFTDNLFGSIAG